MSRNRAVHSGLRRRILSTGAVLALALGPVVGTGEGTALAAKAPAHASAHHKKAQHKPAHHKTAQHKKVKHAKKKRSKSVTQPKPHGASTPTAGSSTTAPVTATAPHAPANGAVSAAGTTSGGTFTPEAPPGGVLGTASTWRHSLANAPLAPNSAAMVANLTAQVTSLYGGVAAFNAWQYNASIYTVDANVPRADVLWDNCQGKTSTPAGLLGPTGVFGQVPIPATAVPATGADSELSVYLPSTDQLWEFWHAHHAADGWHACWGGRIDGVSSSLGYFLGYFGVTATALTASEPVSFNDIRSGVINHAVPIAIVSPADSTRFSWPAQRSDGADTAPDAVPEGTRLRLPATLNVDTLGLTPIGKMIAKAAQVYGMVVVDKGGAVAVIAESGNGDVAASGQNPWNTLLGGVPAYNQLKAFPWSSLQAVVKDYGRPANAPS